MLRIINISLIFPQPARQCGRTAKSRRRDEGPRVRSGADREGMLQELAAGAGTDLERDGLDKARNFRGLYDAAS